MRTVWLRPVGLRRVELQPTYAWQADYDFSNMTKRSKMLTFLLGNALADCQ
jgi:hypothetical protein